MRTKSMLNKFDDVNTLIKYLYMYEDKSITVKNSMNIDIEIKIDDECNLYRANDVTNLKVFLNLSYSELLNVVEQLKEIPAIEFPNRFSSRFEEIKTMTNMSLALNTTRKG